MAGILGKYGYAREQAYFKLEQEAEIQNLRKKWLKERKGIDGEVGEAELVDKDRLNDESTRTFEVGMEILQQQARLYDPQAAARKEFDIRVKGVPADLTPEELLKYKVRVGSIAGYTPAVPKVRFGRNRFDAVFPGQGAGSGQLVPRGMSPEAQELAQRHYATGVRSLIYGSLIGTVGAVFLVGFTLHTNNIHSKEDMKAALESWCGPLGETLRERCSGITASCQATLGRMGLTSSSSSEDSQFTKQLSASLLRSGQRSGFGRGEGEGGTRSE